MVQDGVGTVQNGTGRYRVVQDGVQTVQAWHQGMVQEEDKVGLWISIGSCLL